MKTLHLYLTRQVLATLLITVAVFTFVLLLGNVLKEILSMLVNRQASLLLVIKAVGLLIPYVLVFALPMGMLTATLLVFGRFSADQELTAARASGISLLALITPVLLLSVVLSFVCGWVNLQLAPQCRIAYKNLLYDAAMANPSALLRENQYNDFPGGWSIYARKVKNNDLQDVKVYHVQEDSMYWAKARAGRFVLKDGQLFLTLFEASPFEVKGDNVFSLGSQEEPTLPIPTRSTNDGAPKPMLGEMTSTELWEQLRKLEKSFRRTQASTNTTSEAMRVELKQMAKIRNDVTMPVLVQIHRQIAFSFACIGFTLIGIPLGIRAHRRETSAGFAVALILVLVYYSFTILAQAWDTRPEFAPHLIVWLPNIIFQAVGGVLLWRANKGI